MMETDFGNGYYGIHNIELDLVTMTGLDHVTWYDLDGNVIVSYFEEPFSAVPCPNANCVTLGGLNTQEGK